MDDFGCDINTVYVVELRTNGKSENITLNTENCTNKVCLVIFQDLMENTNGSYEVRVVANNQFNETEVYTSSITISKNNYMCECMLPKIMRVFIFILQCQILWIS